MPSSRTSGSRGGSGVPKAMKGLFTGSGESRCRFLGLYDICIKGIDPSEGASSAQRCRYFGVIERSCTKIGKALNPLGSSPQTCRACVALATQLFTVFIKNRIPIILMAILLSFTINEMMKRHIEHTLWHIYLVSCCSYCFPLLGCRFLGAPSSSS